MTANYSNTLDRLLDGENLSQSEASDLMHGLAAGEIDPALAGAFLSALRAKGETADEIRAAGYSGSVVVARDLVTVSF